MKIEIPYSDYLTRVERTQAAMKESGVDAILAFSHLSEPTYSRYYADFQPAFETAGIWIPTTGAAVLLVGPESQDRAKKTSKLTFIKRMIAFREPATPRYEDNTFDTFKNLLSSTVEGKSLQRIGIGGWSTIPREIFEELAQTAREINANVEFVSADVLLSTVCQIKSAFEISCVLESARITKLAMDAAIAAIQEGATGKQVKGAALAKMYQEGAEGESFCGWVTSGEDTAYPIAWTTDRPFVDGDLIQIEIGARFHGYSSVIGRAVVLGKANGVQAELLQTIIGAKKQVEKSFRTACHSQEIAESHRRYLKNVGKESWMAYGPCHGTGIVECELPWIESATNFPLLENMVFCMDIFLHDEKNKIGARYEDMVWITASGPQFITNYRNEIIEI